jgi:hypothetical protein
VIGQSGAAPRAVRRDPVVLDEQPLVEDLLERPPHRFDVLGPHRPVGVLVVGPVPHTLAHRLERVDVSLDVLPALRVELRDAVRLDVRLSGEAQLGLHRELHRQAVTVPAGAARDVVALHRLEAREHVLEHARFDVVGSRHAVGGRRTLVESPGRAALGLLEAAREDPVLVPPLDHVVIERDEIDVGGQRVVHQAPRAVVPARGTTARRVPGDRGTTLVDARWRTPASFGSGSSRGTAVAAPRSSGARR